MSEKPGLERAREIIRLESRALDRTAELLDHHFLEVVDAIEETTGKVVITGVGKSGIIGMKIAATLSSTGTPALFMHSVEAVMGDLGILRENDILLAISNSGETNEVVNVVIAAEAIGTPAVAMTRNPESTLAQECRYLIPIPAEPEAGALGLAPTTSTTITLALGDALAIVLKERKRFGPEDFARFHPGGSLGQRLSLKVRDIMRTGELLPLVRSSDSIATAIASMSKKVQVEGSRFAERQPGVTLVADDSGRLVGIVTDGDLRRLLQSGFESGFESSDLETATVEGIMTRNPTTVEGETLASEALRIMEVKEITDLPIVGGQGKPLGIIHLHDILGRGKLVL